MGSVKAEVRCNRRDGERKERNGVWAVNVGLNAGMMSVLAVRLIDISH